MLQNTYTIIIDYKTNIIQINNVNYFKQTDIC